MQKSSKIQSGYTEITAPNRVISNSRSLAMQREARKLPSQSNWKDKATTLAALTQAEEKLGITQVPT